MSILRAIFAIAVLIQLAIALKFFPNQGDFGMYANVHNLLYKTGGFILFFEILLRRAKLPKKIFYGIYGFAIFAYFSEMLVEDAGFYTTTLWADQLAHFAAAAFLAFIGFLLVCSEKTTAAMPYKKYMVLSTICLIIVLHEIYEYLSDNIFGTHYIGIGDPVYDTAEDLLIGFLGAVSGLVIGTLLQKITASRRL